MYKHQISSPLTTIICSLEQYLIDENLWEVPSARCKLLLDQENQIDHYQSNQFNAQNKNKSATLSMNSDIVPENLTRALKAAQEISQTINSRDSSSSNFTADNSFYIARALKEICQQFKKPYPINLELDIDAVEDYQLYGDIQDFNLVITHLLNNAAEAYPAQYSQKLIRVWAHLHQDKALIAINDQGAGMSLPQIQKAFDPDYSTKKKKGGLGLYEAQLIVNEKFNGELLLDSKLNSGSGVFILI